MNFKNMFEKHILPVFLSLIMVLSMAPMTVFAADGNQASVTVNGTETEYATVQEAFDAAKKLTDPCTVKVLQSFKSSMVLGVTFTAEDNCDITLDVNGFDMYNRNTRDQASASMFTFEKGTNAHLTVVNNSENRETLGGIFYYPNGTDISNSVFYMEGGYLTIEDVGGDGIKNKTSNYDKISGSILYLDGGNVTINGSKFGEDNNIVPLYVKSGNLTVNGGTFITQQGNALRIAEGFDGKVSLSGGKFSSTFTSSDLDKMGNFVQVYSIPSILREDGGKVDDLLAKGFTYQKDADDKDAESALYREISVVPEPGVKYIAADGTEQSCTEYTELTDASAGDLTGWYAVNGTVNIEGAIGVTGGNTLNLILCDGAQLNLTRTLYMIRGTTLNIYGQSGGTGTLIIESSICQPAIGIMAGFAGGTVTVNIYGGTVTAKTAEGAQPIGLVPSVTAGKANVTIGAGMKCVKTDDQNTAYAYDNTDGTSITITKCTEHKWSYANITDDAHDRTCDLCSTAETGVAHTTASYKNIRVEPQRHFLICACGKEYGKEYHTYTYASNSDGLTHTATCICELAVDDIEHTYKGEDEICICGAVHLATYDGKSYASLQSAIDAAATVGGTVTLAHDKIDENVVVTGGTVTIDLGGNRWGGNIDDWGSFVPLTVNGGSVTLKNGNLFQWWSGSSARTGIVINDGSVTVEGDARVMGGVPERDSLCPSITLNGGTLILKEGAALLTGLQVPEGKTLADYLPEGTAFVKCSYDYESNTMTVSDPQEFVPDVYTANKITERMVIVSHTHDFSGSACPCGFNCDHSTVDTAAGKCETCGKQLEAAIKYNDGAVIGFDSFISALDSVQSNMTEEVTVVLLQNYELNSKYILDRSNNIKLDLNTNTISGIGGFVVNADSKLTLSNGNLSEDFTVEAAGGDVTVSADIGNVGRLGFTNKESKVAVLGGNFNSLDILFTDTESLKNINLSGGYFNNIAFTGDGKTVVITDLLEAGYALKDNKGILKTNPDGLVPYGLTVSANTYFAEIEVVPCEHSEVNEAKGYCNFCGKLYAGKITDKNGAVRYVEKLQNDDFADGNTVKLMQSVGIIAPGSSCTIEMNGRAADMVNFLVPDGTLTLKGYGNIGTVNLGYDDIDSTLVIEDAAYWMRIEIGTLFVNKTTNTKLNGGQFGKIERKDGGFVEDLLADDHAFFNREWEMPEYISGKTGLTKTYYIAEHHHWFTVNIDGETQCQDCGMPCHHTTIGADGKCEDVCQRQIYTAVLTKVDGTSANYEAFADAWTAAIENEGSTLKLLCDVILDKAEDGIIAQSGKFTLDLNGKTVSGDITYQLLTVSGTADITIRNGKLINTFNKDQSDINNAYANALGIDGGKVTLDQVELIAGQIYQGARSYAASVFSGSLTVVGGTFTGMLAVKRDISETPPSVKITSATLHNGMLYSCNGTTDFDYAGLKAFFADGSMLFDENGKYIDITNDNYWITEADEEYDSYLAGFYYESGAIVKPHTHDSYVDGKCAECDYACPHDSGINDREAGYFEKAICSICHCEYGDFAPDTTAPTGEIKIKERSWWQSLLNTISFGIFYKEEVTVTITADDDSYTQPGYDETKHSVKIEYLISAEALSEEVVKKCGFNEYDGAFGISDEDQYVIYAKLTDHAGNEAYASTDGFEIDKTAPVIENMVDGGHYTYCLETRVKISDKNIDKITLDGREESLNSDGELYLRALNNKEKTLVVTDKAGNTLTVYITGYTTHDIDAETLTCRHCDVAAVAKVTADDFVGYYATLTEALNAGLSDQRENVVVTLLRTIEFGDPAGMRVSLWSCPTSFTLDLNGYTLGGELFDIGGGYYGTLTVISSRPGGALLTTVSMNSEDAVLVMGEGLDGTTAMTGIVHIKGTLKINHGKYGYINVTSSDKKITELYGGEFVNINVATEGLTCADLLAPEYRYDGISYADAKAATTLENVTVVPCAHASLDENCYCADCGFHLVLSVEKDGVTKNFDTFEDAIRYAEQNEGCTVKLLQDLTLDDATVGSLKDWYRIYLEKGRYTLDLAGKTLDIINGNQVVVREDCDLTIGDSAGGGKVISSSGGGDVQVGYYTNNNAKLTVTGGEFNVNVTSYNQSALVLKGGSFKKYVNSAKWASCSPFVYLSDGYAFALMEPASGNNYANEGNVEVDHDGSQMIRNVTVVPAPLTIDEQPTDLKFYLTSREDDKYVEFAVSSIGRWWGDMVNVTFEKEDGTVIQENSVTAFDKQEISVSIVNFTASDSGSYRVKLELKGYVLYSDTFSITVAECEHPGYDRSTNKCTQCGCTITAAIVNGDKTTGYVTFAEALAAAQTDENKGCVLWLLTDVSGRVTVSGGDFKFSINGHSIGGLGVTKTAKLNIFSGTVNGTVTVAKTANLIASVTNFMEAVNDIGNMSSFINCVFAQSLNAKGSNTNLNNCTINGALNISGNEVTLTASTVYGKTTVNNGGLLRFMGNGGKYGETLVKSGGGLEVYSNNTVSGTITAQSGSEVKLSGGVYTEIAAESGAKLTVSGGEFKNITVNGQHLIDCLAEGKAFEDMAGGFIIDGRVGIAGDVKVVDHTHTCVWKTDTHEKLCGCGYVEAVDTEAPVISGIDPDNNHYGSLEFTVTDENDFTVWLDDEEITLVNGKYTMEPDNDTHLITATDVAGNTVSFRFGIFKTYHVTLPTGAGYTIFHSDWLTVRHGDRFSFIVQFNKGYSRTEDFKVLVNGNKLDELQSYTDSASFVVRDVSEDLVITVEGVADITAPEIEVNIHGNSFKEFLNRITFGLFFKQTQTVEVKANDFGSGVDKVEYLLSETAFTDKNAITGDWTELTLNDDRQAWFDIESDQKVFVYVRVTDNSGNITVVNSDGVVVYTDAEAITETVGIKRLDNADASFDVKLNGNTVAALYNGDTLIASDSYTVSADGTITLKDSYLSTLAAGEYTIRVEYNPMGVSFDSGDEPAMTSLKLTVEKKTPELTLEPRTQKTYDGDPIDPSKIDWYMFTDGARTWEYKPVDADDTAYTTTAPKNVGEYTVRLTTAETDNFEEGMATALFVIAPKEITINGATVENSKIYDGTTDAKITNAGTPSDNYDGDNLTIVAGKATYDNKNVGTGKTVTFTEFALAGDAAANYKLIAQPTSVTADITVKEITINGTTVENSKIYDGTTDAKITNAGTLSDNYDGDNLTIVAGKASYDNKNVGTGKTVTFTGFALAGDAAANYKLTAQPTSVTADITVKEITIIGAAVESSKIYDGTTDAKITNAGTPSENYDGDNLTIVAGKATYDNKNVGTGKTVTFTGFALAGDAAANYKLTAQPTSVTADITVKEITINGATVENSKVYDGTTDAKITNAGTPSDNYDGDNLTIVAGSASYDNKNVGTGKTVTFTGFALAGDAADNYKLIAQPTSVTADITVKEITINGATVESSKIYDGTTDAKITNAGTPSDNYDGDNLTIVAGKATYDNKNVGTGKTVTFTNFALAGDAASNYKLVAQPTSVTADITVKEITIIGATVESSKVYDGTTDAKITSAGAPSDNYDGNNLTIVEGSASYENKNVGTGKTVTFTGFALAGDAATNYKLIAQPTSVTADITVKEITINGATVESSKIYDGTTDAKITNAGTPSDNYDGDNLTIVAGKATYDNKNVGTGKTVTFTNFALAGDAASNYKLVAQPTSVTADITVKEITIDNLKVKDKEYDGISRAELDGTPGIVGKVDGDEVELVNGTPSFDTVTVKRDIAISFTEFTLRGRDAANYTLKQPSGITASIVEYVAKGSEYSVNSNDWINTDFIVTAADGWQLSLTDSADGIWTETLTAADETDSGSLEFYVKNTTTGVISTVIREQYKIDLKAPTGEVKLNERNAFQTILNKISFGLFFNADVSVKITAADEASGVSSIMYYMSDSVLEAADVRAITDWTEGSNFGITAEDSAKFIVYVRIEDNAGNISYIGSDGAIFDTTAPEIIGVEDGHTYYVTKRVAVDDDNLAEVTLNDDAVDHVFTIAGDTDATYLIKATDEAGNVTEYKVYMKTIASITDAVSAITVDNVKSDDAETVAIVAQQIMTIGETFDEEESTADEWAKIVAASAKCKELEERISATAAESERLSDGVGAYSIETVKSTDKADIEALLNDTVKLLDGDNLTESERDEVEDIKAALEALLDKLSSVKDAAEDPDITDVSGITKDTVKSEDKDDLEKAKDALKDALDDFDGNLTDDERDDLERKLDDIEKALEAIENAEDASDEIKKLPDPDDVKLSDKDDVKRVSEIVDSLTDNEKTMLGDEAVIKITKLGERIAELEKISFAPSIIEGAGQKWSENSDKDALFRSNAEFDEFVKVLVDGTEIDDSCYKAYAGSTVVELRADYLKTLSAGEHTLSIVSKNGRADTTFTVLEENAGDAPQTDNDSTGNGGNSTQTGDGFIMQFALLFISGGAVIGTAIAAKKRKEEE